MLVSFINFTGHARKLIEKLRNYLKVPKDYIIYPLLHFFLFHKLFSSMNYIVVT